MEPLPIQIDIDTFDMLSQLRDYQAAPTKANVLAEWEAMTLAWCEGARIMYKAINEWRRDFIWHEPVLIRLHWLFDTDSINEIAKAISFKPPVFLEAINQSRFLEECRAKATEVDKGMERVAVPPYDYPVGIVDLEKISSPVITIRLVDIADEPWSHFLLSYFAYYPQGHWEDDAQQA